MTLTFHPYQADNYRDYERLYQPFWLDLKRINTDQVYRDQVSQTGFPVGNPNDEDSELMSDSPFHQVAYDHTLAVGLIRADILDSDDNHQNISWAKQNPAKQAYLQAEGWELGLILVDSAYQKQGIAGRLLERLLDHIREEQIPYLFSWVVNNPPNLPSLAFHHKQGFHHLATYNSKEDYGIQDYESLLFYKQTST